MVENRGVAPFYYDWPVELQAEGGPVVKTDWKLSAVLPGEPVVWRVTAGKAAAYRVRVLNPMKGGKALRFANVEQGAEGLVIVF